MPDFNQTRIFLTDVSESPQHQSVQRELIRAEKGMGGRTDGHDNASRRYQRIAKVQEHKTRHKHLIKYLITRQIAYIVTRFEFYRHISNETPIRNFTKTRPERGDTRGRTDGHENANNVNPTTGHDPRSVPLRFLPSSHLRFVSYHAAS